MLIEIVREQRCLRVNEARAQGVLDYLIGNIRCVSFQYANYIYIML